MALCRGIFKRVQFFFLEPFPGGSAPNRSPNPPPTYIYAVDEMGEGTTSEPKREEFLLLISRWHEENAAK